MHSSNIDEQLGRVAVDRESAVQRLRKFVRLRAECADEVAEVGLDGDSGQNDRIDEGAHSASTTKAEKISFYEIILLIKFKHNQTRFLEGRNLLTILHFCFPSCRRHRSRPRRTLAPVLH